MNDYKIIRHSAMWSTSALVKTVEKTLEQKELEGWEVVSVAFGMNLWWMPTAFITLRVDSRKGMRVSI